MGRKGLWLAGCLILATVIVAAVAFGSIPKIHLGGRASAEYEEISPGEYDTALRERDPFVVDVHIPEQGHLSGTDAFIPYNEIENRFSELPTQKDTEIIVYCRSGSMSSEASQVLANAGYTNVKNLTGGVNAYREQQQAVEITPDSQDLGIVTYGEVKKTEFTLTNFTPFPLVITRVSTSCGCTSAAVEKNTLTPNESTKVSVSFDPAVHQDDTDLGDVIRSIYIETDNPNFSRIESTITANVIKKG